MKRFVFYLIVIAGVAFITYSCKNHIIETSGISPRFDPGEGSCEDCTGYDPSINFWDTFNISGYVDRNSLMFGNNVLIFDSIAEVDSILLSWNELEYYELRSEIENLGINNIAIDKKIKYDSIKATLWEGDYNDYLAEDDLPDDFYSDFYDEIIDNDPTLIYSYQETVTDEESPQYGLINTVIEPTGKLSIDALLNDKRIVIVEGNVIKKLLDGNIISCPIINYTNISNYEDVDVMEAEVPSEQNPTESDFQDPTKQIYDLVFNYDPSKSNIYRSNFNENYVNNHWYKIKYEYTTGRLYSFFHDYADHNFYGHLTIKNYKKIGSTYLLTRFPTSGYLNSTTSYETVGGSWDTAPHYIPINSSFSTFIKYKSSYVYTGSFRPYYLITYFHINITNGRVSIENQDYGNY